jgi:hypothetical protein
LPIAAAGTARGLVIGGLARGARASPSGERNLAVTGGNGRSDAPDPALASGHPAAQEGVTVMSSSTLIEIQAFEARSPRLEERSAIAQPWTSLYRIAGAAALAVVALIPIQVAVYLLWPPPTSVLDYFTIFQSNVLQGMLDLDLLLIVDQVLMMAVLLGLYTALRWTDESLMLIGTAVGLVGAVLLVVSREATFSMLPLSQQYADASAESQRAALVAAGQTLLTVYNGTSFSLGYFLSGLAMLLVSTVMLRGAVFSRMTGVAGVVAGVTGLVPANMGTLGFVLSFMSLLPMVVWLILLGRRLLQFGSGTTPSAATQ